MDNRRPTGGRRPAGPPFLVAALALFCAAPAAAETFTVAGREDTNGKCDGTRCPSIRSALLTARDGDTISIGVGEYQLALGQLDVNAGVTLAGAGAGRTTIRGDGANGVRVLRIGNVQIRPAVSIRDVTIAGGGSVCDRGGNVLNYGRLQLDHVRLTDGDAAHGGGLANEAGGIAVVERSLVDATERAAAPPPADAAAGSPAAPTTATR